MKKILYVVKYPLNEMFTIRQKVDGQLAALGRMGYDVYYIGYDTKNVYLINKGEKKRLGGAFMGSSKLYLHIFSFFDLFKYAAKAVREVGFDIVYFRWAPLNGYGIKLFSECRKAGTKLVVEIPTYPATNEKPKNRLRALYGKRSSRLWDKGVKNVSLFAVIGEHIDFFKGVPAINIDNGIDISGIPEVKRDRSDGKTHILAVASMCDWHGYDRLIRGLAAWRSGRSNDYVVDMVGGDGDGSLAKWKELAKELGAADRVVFHGRLTGEDLTRMYNKASVGVSSLGLYRTGFESGSVLKLREYMARGLPFVYAHDDPDMNDEMKWCVRIPNDGSDVDMETVDRLVKSAANDPEIPGSMRAFAEKNMTWEAQFERVFSALERINPNECGRL